MKPEILQEIPDALQMNKQLMERIMTDKGFEEFREYTRLDDLASALGTMKYSETVLKWIEDQVQQNQAFQNALQQIMGSDGANQKAGQQAAKALEDALEQNGQQLRAWVDQLERRFSNYPAIAAELAFWREIAATLANG